MDISSILNAVLKSTTQSNQAIDAQAAQMQQDTAEMQQLMQLNMGELQQASQIAGTVAAESAKIQYQRASQREGAQRIAGLDPEDQENQFVRSFADLNTAQQEQKTARAEWDKRNQIGFLDNPVGYIMAQLEMPKLAAVHNAAANRVEAAQENIAARTTMLNQYNSTVVANTAQRALANDLKAAELKQIEANVKLREAEISNTSAIAGQRMRIAQLEDKKQDNLRQALSMNMQAAQFQMSMEERKEARAERAMRKQQTAAEQKKKDLEESQFNLGLARVSQFLGLPVTMNMQTLAQMPDAKKKQKWIEAAYTMSLGEDLKGSLEFFKDNANVGALQKQNPGVTQAARAMSTAIESYGNSLSRIDPKTGKAPTAKEIALLAPETYQTDIIAAASNPQAKRTLSDKYWDGMFNPYKANHKVMLNSIQSGEFPELKSNIMVQALETVKTAVPADAPNFRGEDEARAIKVIAEKVKRRELTPKAAAAQVSQYFETAAKKNMELYQYDLFNLPPQTRYNVTIMDTSGVFSSEARRADLINTASTEKLLTQLAVGEKKQAFTTPGGFWR